MRGRVKESQAMAALTQLCCSSSSKSIYYSAPSSSPISAIRTNSPPCSCLRYLGSCYLSLRSASRPHVAPRACQLARPWNRTTGAFHRARATAVSVQQQQLPLPGKLREIVKLFEAVPDSKQKYEQLLYYAKQLKPLAKEFCTKENKVEGCVSQVWVKPTLTEDYRVFFEADSDSLLTKGLAALLVEGLSGATVSEILKVTPDFIRMLGLKQSLTPSRSNGFLNMLKLMQKKTLGMYMEAEAAKTGSGNSVKEVSSQVSASVSTNAQVTSQQMDSVNSKSFSSVGAPEQMSKKDSIQKKLQEALAPTILEVDDVSHQHAGHAGVHKGATETHFNVKVVSDKFAGTSLIKRHRLVYELLDEEIRNGVHALSLVTKTPPEIGK